MTAEAMSEPVATTADEVDGEPAAIDPSIIVDADGNPLNDIYHVDGRPRAGLKDGIYIGMPNYCYFAQDRLGSSDFKVLGDDEPENWFFGSAHNPKREEETRSPELVFGDALHAYVLEGATVFESRFIEYPVTYIADKGKDKGKEKPWNRNADVCATWEVEQKRRSMTPMAGDTYELVQDMGRLLRNHPDHKEQLEGGLSELTVLFTVGGVPCRARFDKLFLNGILDLKSAGKHKTSTASPMWLAEKGLTRDQHTCLLIIRNMGYSLQRYLYSFARVMMRDFIRNDCAETPFIYGASPGQMKWLTKIQAIETWTFTFLFYRKVSHSRKSPSAPIITPIVCEQGDVIDVRGYEKFSIALENYASLVARFGFDIPWLRVNEAVTIPDTILNEVFGPSLEAKPQYQHGPEEVEEEEESDENTDR